MPGEKIPDPYSRASINKRDDTQRNIKPVGALRGRARGSAGRISPEMFQSIGALAHESIDGPLVAWAAVIVRPLGELRPRDRLVKFAP